MKARNIIGGTTAVIGLVLAICTADGSAHEIALRLVGVALFATGAFITKSFDFQNKEE